MLLKDKFPDAMSYLNIQFDYYGYFYGNKANEINHDRLCNFMRLANLKDDYSKQSRFKIISLLKRIELLNIEYVNVTIKLMLDDTVLDYLHNPVKIDYVKLDKVSLLADHLFNTIKTVYRYCNNVTDDYSTLVGILYSTVYRCTAKENNHNQLLQVFSSYIHSKSCMTIEDIEEYVGADFPIIELRYEEIDKNEDI